MATPKAMCGAKSADFLPFTPQPWDSEILGFRVGKVSCSSLPANALTRLSHRLSASDFVLLYIDCEHASDLSDDCLPPSCSSFLFSAGANLIYERELTPHLPVVAPHPELEIGSFEGFRPTAELQALAVLSGKTSRFRKDPRVPEESFHRLYRQWLTSSLKNAEHCSVLVARHKDRLAGFAIARRQASFGLISLIAVHSLHQSQGLGRALVCACEQNFSAAGLQVSRIVTQPDNVAACSLYARAGYRVLGRRWIYHLWNPTHPLAQATHQKSCVLTQTSVPASEKVI